MNLFDVNNALNYKIVAGDEFLGKCYGSNTRLLEYRTEFGYASVVFNFITQHVFEATVNDVADNHRYRYIDKDYFEDFLQESKLYQDDYRKAWDNKCWTDLEDESDFLTKAIAILENKEFDKRITVPINLDDSELLQLCLEAHKKDITLNQMIEQILVKVIEQNNVTND
jgi:hypothetical protein